MATKTIGQMRKAVQRAVKRMETERTEMLLRVAENGLALVKSRVQQSGENAQGGRFEPYTEQYAKYGRDRQGYQSQYVDFTRTGRMFASMQPVVVKETATLTVVEVRPNNTADRVKAEGQFKKRGNFMALSNEEDVIIRKDIQAWFVGILEEELGL